jgi:hypothetical protein
VLRVRWPAEHATACADATEKRDVVKNKNNRWSRERGRDGQTDFLAGTFFSGPTIYVLQ